MYKNPFLVGPKAYTNALPPYKKWIFFMALTARQELTIQHLSDIGITEKDDIIRWCLERIPRFSKRNSLRRKDDIHKPYRKHSQKYYYDIIEHFSNS